LIYTLSFQIVLAPLNREAKRAFIEYRKYQLAKGDMLTVLLSK